MIVPAGAADGLESLTRPHFFTGVATIVLKLFQHVPAHSAIFGEKDFQQLSVVRQMARNLDLQIDIIGAATVHKQTSFFCEYEGHNRCYFPDQASAIS